MLISITFFSVYEQTIANIWSIQSTACFVVLYVVVSTSASQSFTSNMLPVEEELTYAELRLTSSFFNQRLNKTAKLKINGFFV